MSPKHLDYLIIGQGLAGSALAIKLLKLKRKFLVVDEPTANVSSRVAAGLFNPITGKKMVKTWMADELFPALHTHYTSAESLTGSSFFYTMPVYRPFASAEEQNEWMGKSLEPGFSSYIDKVQTAPMIKDVKDPHGGLMLKQCGYLDTVKYLTSVRNLLENDEAFCAERVDSLQMSEDGVRFKNYLAERVVYCTGTHQSATFNWLPIRPLKGEVLLIAGAGSEGAIINRGVYVVPQGNGTWRVGATYNFGDNEPGTTEKSRAELLTRLQALANFPFSIVNQEWGFRPTTPDRRPILGRHPKNERAWIMNGMGTKGVSLAPYFAEVLIRSIENGEPLNKEVDIERYKSLYWTS
ncbi:MAG: FAD-dependent oxidoreductase [Chryseolinea sp.]